MNEETVELDLNALPNNVNPPYVDQSSPEFRKSYSEILSSFANHLVLLSELLASKPVQEQVTPAVEGSCACMSPLEGATDTQL